VVFALLVAGVGNVEARMTIRMGDNLDEFRFHAQYWDDAAFDPAADFTLAIWTCPDGGMPAYLAGFDPVVACRDDIGASVAADLAYGVTIAGGTCVDHGHACYARRSDAAVEDGGVRLFKVRYARSAEAGNKIWLETVGDLSHVVEGNMLLQILIDGRPRALLEGHVRPLGSRGLSVRF
jgi:hypothetical protein